MSDSLTNQIIQELQHLPDSRKKAVLEVIRQGGTTNKRQKKTSKDEWKRKLLSTSVWSDADVAEINKAREYINKWQPKQFS